ncbi:MAG: alpha/beta fold hydrolase [Flavobacteriaceae bacterium]|nr:alpha/beta fold hydrolase [Flavobacteriaceae bacterium]
MLNNYTIIILLFFSCNSIAQEEINIKSNDITSYGTLLEPKEKTDVVVLIISGSGETDRDGNTIKIGYTNNCLKMLSEQLAENKIASLRYDKRGVGKSTNSSVTAESIRFNQYIDDAENWIKYLKKRYKKVIVAGHSQGALVGILAVQNTKADKFISLSGLSEGFYTTVKRQLSNQPQFVLDAALPILDSLKIRKKVDSVPQYLNSLFNPRIQDYIISFMEYDPRKEITKLEVPTLFVIGTTDMQITVEGTKAMHNLSNDSQLEIIEGMNHVLKEVELETTANMATYSNPNLALHQDLVGRVVAFINK